MEYVGLALKHLDGTSYVIFRTDTLDPGDTAVTDSTGVVWLDNQSNVPVNIVAWAYDDTLYCAPDPVWNVESVPGTDTCSVGLANYTFPAAPSPGDAIWLDESPRTIETGIPPGEDRFEHLFFIAPTDPAEYGERSHRVGVVIGLVSD